MIGPEHELRVRRDGQMSRLRGAIPDTKTLYANGIRSLRVDWHEAQQGLFEPVAVVFKLGIALPVARAISIILAHRKRRGRPEDSGVVVADVDRLGRRIGYGIVVPWCQTV